MMGTLARLLKLKDSIEFIKGAIHADYEDFGTTEYTNHWWLDELVKQFTDLIGG